VPAPCGWLPLTKLLVHTRVIELSCCAEGYETPQTIHSNQLTY